MKQHTSHNIICLEAEWEYSEQNPKNRFSLNTLPMLNWLKEAYDCEVIYRRFRTKSDLKYYLGYFRTHAKGDDEEEDFNKYDIIYFACHGEKKSLWIEGESVPLTTLQKWAKGFFKDKVIHFGSCRTMSNKIDSKHFKRECQTLMVSGYQKSVDAMDSSIADIAIMNDLLSQEEIVVERYTDELKPMFKSTPTQFQTIIFASPTDINVGDHVGDVSEIKLTERQQVILTLIKESPSITAKQMSETLSVSQRTIERDLSVLKDKDVLRREGKDNDGAWIINRYLNSVLASK